jgi:Trypsin-like peptidase domain
VKNMRIDWESDADVPEQTRRLANEPRSGRHRGGLESTQALPLAPDERLERLAASINRSDGTELEQPDPDVASEILRGAASALAKADDPNARYTFRERAGLEAVVLTDGTRPSLTVKGGFVDLGNPEIGDWDQPFQAFGDAMKGVIAAVGRVNIPTSVGYAGTCFAIAPDLVLTNRHVLEEIARQDSNGTWTLLHPEATTIDFVAEAGGQTLTNNKVISVVLAGADPINRQINFAHLDLAVLKLDPAMGLLAAVTLEASTDALGEGREVYLVGFPARPRTHYGEGMPLAGYETSEVMASVFKWKFGVKKLAPGKVDKVPGDLAGDAKGWVFSHDASTLGGNSGSAVVDLSIDGARVVGLHFGGLARKENWSHAVARIDELRQTDNLTWI